MSAPSSSQQRLAQARQVAAAHGTTVLDELDAGLPLDEVDALCRSAGVATVRSADAVAIRLGPVPENPQNLAAVAARLQDGQDVLLAADPWDHSSVDHALQRCGRYLEPVAATAAVLRAWPSEPIPKGTGAADAVTTAMPTGVVAFVDAAIAKAYADGASDVHFECDRQGVTVKLRLDGVMSPAMRLQGRQPSEEVISRIKVLAQLDITERRLPQDGRFRHGAGDTALDLRVSIMPSVHGEDAVLRLLDKSHLRASENQVTLPALGFDEGAARQIRRLAHRPNGMLLVTGPTGSGKTTTIYATLTEINDGREKIVTIEDPVEYELPGVLQIPVNEHKGLSFARGLRSILRHDPDRILVGEIRDAETAAIAIQSALTGHLVFTTVHANSLFDVIGRFRHFGIDMFGFVWSLNGVVVQRLLRRLCTQCATRREPTPEEAGWLATQGRSLQEVPAAAGCEACRCSGYRGRFVVSEIHTLSDELRDLIMRNVDVTELKKRAFGVAARPLIQAAIDHVAASRTTLEEVFRVVGQV